MNALKELKDELAEIGKSLQDIVYAWIINYTDTGRKVLVTEDCNILEKFLDNLNYDDGYGSMELDGEILFSDGTWLERGEYNGSEWWEYIKYLPKEVMRGHYEEALEDYLE